MYISSTLKSVLLANFFPPRFRFWFPIRFIWTHTKYSLNEINYITDNYVPLSSIQSWKCDPIQRYIPISLLLWSIQRAGRGSLGDGSLFVCQCIRISLALLSDEREGIKDGANYKHRRESRGTLAPLMPNFVSIVRRKKRPLAAYNLGRCGHQMWGGVRGWLFQAFPAETPETGDEATITWESSVCFFVSQTLVV